MNKVDLALRFQIHQAILRISVYLRSTKKIEEVTQRKAIQRRLYPEYKRQETRISSWFKESYIDRGPNEGRQIIKALLEEYGPEFLGCDSDDFVIQEVYKVDDSNHKSKTLSVNFKRLEEHLTALEEGHLTKGVSSLRNNLFDAPGNHNIKDYYDPLYLVCYMWQRENPHNWEEVEENLFPNLIELRYSKSSVAPDITTFTIYRWDDNEHICQPRYTQTGWFSHIGENAALYTRAPSNLEYQTYFVFKLPKQTFKEVIAGEFLAGSYTTLSRNPIENDFLAPEPVGGLCLIERFEDQESALDAIYACFQYAKWKNRTKPIKSQRLKLHKDKLDRIYAFLYKQRVDARRILEPLGVAGSEKTRHPFDLYGFPELHESVPSYLSGNFQLRYIDAHERKLETGIFRLYPNGDAELELANRAISHGFCRLTRNSGLLIAQFGKNLDYPDIQFVFLRNQLSQGTNYLSEVGEILHGTFLGINSDKEVPMTTMGRAILRRLKTTPTLLNEELSQLKTFNNRKQLAETTKLTIDILNSDNERSDIGFLLGFTEFKNDLVLGDSAAFYAQIAGNGKMLANVFEKFNDSEIYQINAGVYELYSLSTHEKFDGSHWIQRFPLLIDPDRRCIEIRSRYGKSYFGILERYENGIMQMVFNRDAKWKSHYMTKLFDVKARDLRSISMITGISLQTGSDNSIRASKDLLVSSKFSWDDEKFTWTENAMPDLLRQSEQVELIKRLQELIANPVENLIVAVHSFK